MGTYHVWIESSAFAGGEALDLNLGGNGVGSFVTLNVTGGDDFYETVNVHSLGGDNHVDLGTNAETIATINVDGAENLRICGDALNQDTLTTFDASAATGDVTAIFEGANDGGVDVIGGDGNDNFWFLVTDDDKTKVRQPSQRTTLSMAAVATIRLPSKPSKERCSGPALVQISLTLPPSCTQPTSTHAFSSVTTASSIPCRMT